MGLSNTIELRENCLDYRTLVRPQRVLETLTRENFQHAEDFFFRSVHLGTDCWAFIATYLLKKALVSAEMHEWNRAAIMITQASRIFNYLGDHVMMLTHMVVRDYLDLKVEIEGTSGEGSVLVKSFKSHVAALLFPLYQGVCLSDGEEMSSNIDELCSDAFRDGLLLIYSSPEVYPALYSYAKALETIESSLLGGFYYKHFMLANNMIGSKAKGTMNKSVQALRSTYETPCFPGIHESQRHQCSKCFGRLILISQFFLFAFLRHIVLDQVRCHLGEYFNSHNNHRKGKIMLEIEKKRISNSDLISTPTLTATESRKSDIR